MTDLGFILYTVVRLYTFILIVRIITEMIASFSRSFSPPRWFSIIAEPIFAITDPPVKLLRRIIPPLRLGGVAIDVSIIVLFVLLNVATYAIYIWL